MSIIFRYIFLTALRDKLYLGLIIALFFAFGIAGLMGYTSLVEAMTMQMVVFAASARLIIVGGMILFICFYIHRSFDTKELQFILSKNISRRKFILSYWLSFNAVASLLFVPVILVLFVFNNPNFLGACYWLLGIWFELLIVSTFALLSSLILHSVIISILATFGFYLLSRLMGFFITTFYLNFENDLADKLSKFAVKLSDIIAHMVPRLDLFAETNLLVYGIEGNAKLLLIMLLQTLIYVSLMLCISFYDFDKKEF